MGTQGKRTRKLISKKTNDNQPAPLTKEFASKVLSRVPVKNGFYFYTSAGNPTGAIACTLGEFSDRVKSLPAVTIEFHLARGDFENWVRFLGDDDLAQQITALRAENLSGETLCQAFVSVIQQRQSQLQKLI